MRSLKESLKPMKPGFSLIIAVRPYCMWLAIISAFLLLSHLGLYSYSDYIQEVPWLVLQLFDMDEENNLPSWWSSFLLLNVAFIVFIAARSVTDQFRRHWFLIAAGFLVLAVDEVAGLHETFNSATESNWAIFGGVLVLLVGIAFIPFLNSLDKALAVKFILSGAVFVSGAIVVELLSEDMDSDTIQYTFAVALEEGMEMLGVLMFLYFNLNRMQSDERVEIVAELV